MTYQTPRTYQQPQSYQRAHENEHKVIGAAIAAGALFGLAAGLIVSSCKKTLNDKLD